MFNKKIIIIAVVLLVVIVGAGSAIYYFSMDKKVESDPTGGAQGGGENPIGTLPGGGGGEQIEEEEEEVVELSAAEKEVIDLKKLARFFTEMLGSYSPAANFKNIIDLKPLMSADMKRWADSFIKNNIDELDEDGERMTTRAAKAEILSATDRWAKILVSTRRERTLAGETELFNQEAELILIKIGSQWLVDEVVWQ